jgi:hypothetical protein
MCQIFQCFKYVIKEITLVKRPARQVVFPDLIHFEGIRIWHKARNISYQKKVQKQNFKKTDNRKLFLPNFQHLKWGRIRILIFNLRKRQDPEHWEIWRVVLTIFLFFFKLVNWLSGRWCLWPALAASYSPYSPSFASKHGHINKTKKFPEI